MKKNKVQVAAYYFPNHHVDERNCEVHGPGWTEWEILKCARPRFDGHQQPKVPLWGYEDESDPIVMGKKIDAAVQHGVDCFIFDWYCVEDGLYRERALNEGFLKSSNCDKIKFAIMWANHERVNMHPAPYSGGDNVICPRFTGEAAFDEMTDHLIKDYFSHPSYWKINGSPYFSIFSYGNLMEDLGGVDGTVAALKRFRQKVKNAGFPDLHLNAIAASLQWGIQSMSLTMSMEELITQLGINSITSYQWLQHSALDTFPTVSSRKMMQDNFAYWKEADNKYDIPYYPNITMGWDPSPRTVQSDVYVKAAYPFCSVVYTSPSEFREALDEAHKHLTSRPEEERIITINAWNEWAEGSYLEPDLIHGYAYLEAIRDSKTCKACN